MRLSEFLSNFPDNDTERDGWVVPCPSHDDSHYSLKVSVTDEGKLLLKCRAGCSFGDVMSELPITERDLFDVENDTELSSVAGGPRPEVSAGRVAELKIYLDTAHQAWLISEEDEFDSVAGYCAERFGLSEDSIADLGMGLDVGNIPFTYTGPSWTGFPRLVVPFRGFDGVARAAQGRDLSGSATVRWCSLSNPQDGSWEWSKLAVFDRGTGLDTFIITEGPGDALTAYAAGYNAVAIRGAALKSNPRLIQQLTEGLKGKRVLVCGDNDRAGKEFTQRLSTDLAAAGLDAYSMSVPFDAEDLSDAYQSHPVDFGSALEDADRAAEPPGNVLQPRSNANPNEPDGYLMTDLGNANRLVDSWSGDLRYSEGMGFHLYSGGVWRPDEFDAVRTTAHEVTARMIRDGDRMAADGEARGDAQLEEAGKKLRGWGKASQSTRAIEAMTKEAKSIAGVRVAALDFDQHKHLLTFSNGVVDLRDGTLMPHDRDLMLTRMIPTAYDPAAACPRWEQFLAEVFPDSPDMPAFLRRLIGYGITGDTSEQAFAVLWGTGANGKSVFTETLGHVFDDITTTTPFSTFEAKKGGGGIPNDLAALNGARLVLASEGEQGAHMSESVIKRMTGEDKISARFMRREFFEFYPTFLILLATNFKPNFRGQDEGLWRRVKLIPFRRFFAPDERDHYLTQKLQQEAAGIAAWAVRGAGEWYKNGLGEPDVVVKATESYRHNSDALDGFVPGVFEPGAPEDRVEAQEVYARYNDWCDEMELATKERWSRRALYSAMEERGFDRIRSNGKRYILGLKWAGAAPERTEAPNLTYTDPKNTSSTPLVQRLNPGGSK